MARLFDKWHRVNRIVKFDMYPLYTRCVRYIRYAYVNISSAREFSRGALAFIRPVIPRSRAPMAYNRINAVIRTSLQCNSLALQSSKVFIRLPLCLFYSQNIIFTGCWFIIRRLSENLHLTLRRATRFALQENYCHAKEFYTKDVDHLMRRLNCISLLLLLLHATQRCATRSAVFKLYRAQRY